jgi:predicted nucleic acid-binding protein
LNAFVDSDVILNLLLARSPFATDTEKLFDLATKRIISLYTTPVVISNIYYICNDLNKNKGTKPILLKLRRVVQILPMDAFEVDNALESKFKDFEDSLQYYCCVKNDIAHIITRNKKDFSHSKIPVSTPKEFLKLKLVEI